MNPKERYKSEDEKLSEIAARLRQPEEAPGLWERIEKDLVRRQGRTPLELHCMRRRKAYRYMTALAAAVLLICTLVFLFQQNGTQWPSLLLEEDKAALAEKEKVRLEQQLARLEPLFLKEMASRKKEAAMLAGYLEVLDTNIETCQKAWQGNKLNRGVQRSLLTGYRKKLELLQNFISARV